MSINFERPVDDATVNLIKEVFGSPVAHDQRRFLLDKMDEIDGADMKRIVNSAKQPATVELHKQGEVKTLDDGTRYRVTPSGWQRLEE